jgi:hypothetical protein
MAKHIFTLISEFSVLIYFPWFLFEHNSKDINKKGEMKDEKSVFDTMDIRFIPLLPLFPPAECRNASSRR